MIIIYCIGILTLYLLFKSWKNTQKNKSFPREFSPTKIGKVGPGNIKNGFSKRKIDNDVDVIVIGSGIGGLTCAGLLSRVGKKVLVLEQHTVAGGCTHTFVDKGYEFDTGVHYIGNIEKRKKILDLITSENVEWDKMGTKENGYLYDEISINNDIYNFRAGKDAFLEEINNHFPEEIENVKRYLAYVKEVSKKGTFFHLKVIKYKWLAKLIGYFQCKEFFESTRETAIDVIVKFTKNKRLQAVLMGQFGDYGKSPNEESFFVHASVVNHYLDGAWYPRGGSEEIAKRIVPIIESTGGKVLVRKKVKSILVDKNGAHGVLMENGVVIKARKVISACGVPNTWLRLVDKNFVPQYLIDNINKLGYSCSFTYVFVGMNKSPSELKLRGSNIWHWPDQDYDKMLNEYHKDPLHAPIPMFIGFPCAKDSTWETRYPGKSTAVILTMSKFDQFKKWENKKLKHRGEEYKKIKDQYAKRILEEGLYHYYPQTKGTVDYVDVASPLTFNYYINSLQGEAYGLDNKPSRFSLDDWLRPITHINNLYLTGQDISTLGVTGAMMAGVITAHSVLGYGGINDLITGRNLIEDIMHLDKIMKDKEN